MNYLKNRALFSLNLWVNNEKIPTHVHEKSRSKKLKLFSKILLTIAKTWFIMVNVVRARVLAAHICESGGTGRRARLRGVWIHRTGSSPVSRTTKASLR